MFMFYLSFPVSCLVQPLAPFVFVVFVCCFWPTTISCVLACQCCVRHSDSESSRSRTHIAPRRLQGCAIRIVVLEYPHRTLSILTLRWSTVDCALTDTDQSADRNESSLHTRVETVTEGAWLELTGQQEAIDAAHGGADHLPAE